MYMYEATQLGAGQLVGLTCLRERIGLIERSELYMYMYYVPAIHEREK